MGSLQQGLGSYRPPKKQEAQWGLQMDVEALRAREQALLDDICQAVALKQTKSGKIENTQFYKGVASEFINSKPKEPHSFRNSGVVNFNTSRKDHDRKPVKKITHYRYEKREQQLNRGNTLPQLTKPARFLDLKKPALRKKLSKAALRSGARLSRVLEEM